MNGQIIVTGANILRNPAVNTNSNGGNDGQGTLRVQNGQQAFDADDIVVFDVLNLTADGEVSGASAFTGITVYEDLSAFQAGTAKFTYTPQNPGQTANVQNDISGLGDGYVRFNANVLRSSDPGAPNINQLFVAGGRDLLTEIAAGPIFFDRNQDFDFDGDGAIDPGTIEEGNNQYFAGTGSAICFVTGTLILTPNGAVPVERLHAGDRVITRDHGAQPIQWVGAQPIPPVRAAAPIRFDTGALDNDRPLLVSPNHRILLSGPDVALICDAPEVLIGAKKLVGAAGVSVARGDGLSYHHMLCAHHELIYADGALAETLHPGRQALRAMSDLGLAVPLSAARSASALVRPEATPAQAALLRQLYAPNTLSTTGRNRPIVASTS